MSDYPQYSTSTSPMAYSESCFEYIFLYILIINLTSYVVSLIAALRNHPSTLINEWTLITMHHQAFHQCLLSTIRC